MATFLRTRLSLQMFLQFAIWGVWVPVLGNHLKAIGFTDGQIGSVYATGPLATMATTLLFGQLADRYLPLQWVIAAAYLLAGVFSWLAADAVVFGTFWWLALASMLFFAPTLGLANALSFHHLQDSRRDFPLIRVWGTVGWIAAGFLLKAWMDLTGRPIGDSLRLAGVLAVLNAGYVLSLPHTPPRREASSPFALGEVLAKLRDPSFAIFSLLAIGVMVFASFYYTFAGVFFEKQVGIASSNVPVVMGIGQALEILTMLALPWVYRQLGAKGTIALGILAWGVRFALFALGGPWELMVAAQALHGICFAFAIAAGMIYIERVSPADLRGSMQSFLAFITYGLGMCAGSYIGGATKAAFGADWRGFWLVPAVACGAVLVVFLAGFKARDGGSGSAGASGPDAS